jgi:hypothetical protein
MTRDRNALINRLTEHLQQITNHLRVIRLAIRTELDVTLEDEDHLDETLAQIQLLETTHPRGPLDLTRPDTSMGTRLPHTLISRYPSLSYDQ